MGPAMELHVRGLLDVMFSAGLSLTLVDALEQITIRYNALFMDLLSHTFGCKSFEGF
jgi:FKBP12-rapamycin complex-associated protein